MNNNPPTDDRRDHSKEVEARLNAIRIAPRDCCIFFHARASILGEPRECWYCVGSTFNEEDGPSAVGFCRFKQ